jgi:hypothetical protein
MVRDLPKSAFWTRRSDVSHDNVCITIYLVNDRVVLTLCPPKFAFCRSNVHAEGV